MKFNYSKKNHAFLALFIFIINAVRNTGPFRYPSFWAEDATFFFKDSIELGLSSLWTPIIGHYHTIPRIIAWLATFFHPYYAPLLYAIGAGIVSSLVFSWFYRPSFSWLIKEDAHRFFIGAVLSLCPGTIECFFALCTLNYIIYLGIIFLLLEKSNNTNKFSISKQRAIFISFLWFSAGQGISILPLLLALIWITKNPTYLTPIFGLFVSAYMNILSVIQNQQKFPIRFSSAENIPQLLTLFFDNLYIRYVYLPFVGELGLHLILQSPDWFFSPFAIVILLSSIYFLKKINFQDYDLLVLAALMLCATALFVMIALVRDAPEGMIRPNYDLRSRYTLVPTAISVTLYLAFILKSNWLNHKKWLTLLICLFVLHNIYVEGLVLRAVKFEPFLSIWQERAEEINTALLLKRSNSLKETVLIRNIPAKPENWGGIETLRIEP